MEIFRSVVKALTFAALGLAALQIYLTLNKLWKRKHEAAVAESISIMGESIGLLPLLFLTAHFLLEGQWEGAVDGAMWLLAGCVTVAIGTGRWVEGKRGQGFWKLLLGSVGREREEVGDLAMALFRPSGAEKILDILRRLAWIDRELDERERAFIAEFAASWGIELDPEDLEAGDATESGGYADLRRAVTAYLHTSPPPAQVQQLGDVIHALVRVDASVSAEESLMLEELDGLLAAYLAGDGATARQAVVIVPQDEAQDEAVRDLMPDARDERLQGGRAYVVGHYFSERYADMVGDRYRALGFFTTVLRDHPEADGLRTEAARPGTAGLQSARPQ